MKFKYSYTKEGKREQVTTTINSDLIKKFRKLSSEIGQPTSKMYDILLIELFEKSEDELENFIMKVKLY